MEQSNPPTAVGSNDWLGRVIDWKETCGRCKHLLRSGADGYVWRCAVVHSGKKPAYAVTARAGYWRRLVPADGCGRDARLFEAA